MCATLGRSDNVAKFNKIFCTQNGILKYLDKEAWKICSDEAWQNLKKAIRDCSTALEKYKTCDEEKK